VVIKGTSGDDFLEGTNKNDTLKGNAGDDFIFSGSGDDLVSGGDGNDFLYGGGQGEAFFTMGGSDTLTGGKGKDSYYVSLENSGGSVIKGESADSIVQITAENTDVNSIVSTGIADIVELFSDPNTWGDAAIELSSPKKGIIGLEKSGTDLIIDINRDGVAEASDDLAITNYFDDQGDLGKGAPLFINNIINQQDIVDFFA
jgi:Ca2+-binding RTX toxin-like protein